MSQSILTAFLSFNRTKLCKGDGVQSSQLTPPAKLVQRAVFSYGVLWWGKEPQIAASETEYSTRSHAPQVHTRESCVLDSELTRVLLEGGGRNLIPSGEGSFLLTGKDSSKQTLQMSYKAKDLLELSNKAGKLKWLQQFSQNWPSDVLMHFKR